VPRLGLGHWNQVSFLAIADFASGSAANDLSRLTQCEHRPVGGPSHPAYDGYFDSAPPLIPAGSGCVISSRIAMGISVAGPRRGER